MRREAWRQRPGCVWSAAGAVAGLLILLTVLGITALSRSASARAELYVPQVTIVPRPSATMPAPPTPTIGPTATPAPSRVAAEDGDRIAVGSLVEVYGTEGDGLRLRASPGTGSAIQVLAGESEVFLVQDGPAQADGHLWYFLVSPSDAARAGWAVAEYLRPAQ